MNTNTPPSVEGCTSCGALYEAVPGDRGVCAACRRLLPSDPPWRAPSSPTLARVGATPASATKPVGAFKRPGVSSAQRASFGPRRGFRRLVIGAALLAAGAGAFAVLRPRALSEAWTEVQRQKPAELWTTAQRRASHEWIALRKRLPFREEPQVKRSAPVGPGTPSHRHAQTTSKPRPVAKRSRDDLSAAGSTP